MHRKQNNVVIVETNILEDFQMLSLIRQVDVVVSTKPNGPVDQAERCCYEGNHFLLYK